MFTDLCFARLARGVKTGERNRQTLGCTSTKYRKEAGRLRNWATDGGGVGSCSRQRAHTLVQNLIILVDQFLLFHLSLYLLQIKSKEK